MTPPDVSAANVSNPYRDLLLKGISEVCAYQQSECSTLPSVYFDELLKRLQYMTTLESGPILEQQVDALGRIMVDEFPLTDAFAPSISQILDTQQRLVRQRRRQGRGSK